MSSDADWCLGTYLYKNIIFFCKFDCIFTFNQQLDKAYENATAEIKKLIDEQQKQDSDTVKKQEAVSEIESKLKTLDCDIKTA